ncbi:DUF3343 domain-containing protein [Acetivibrio cellulolyticus]|uniref:DUF3343 domain-containing protein n=1 Tax=Acetivibrio cellulolyticus TaxID=35830 RepID=UPI0001E2E2C9|nr:DUF3343 domain-containing protein [Acetivibrio cellulolyticus]
MVNYYVGLESRSYAFLLERRMKIEGIECEISFVPREIMNDLCNMGVRFGESVLPKAVNLLRQCGLPGCRLYKEIVEPDGFNYFELQI